MKIGKQPRRFGGPSTSFEQRKAAELRRLSMVVPAEGPLKLFLDDERSPPDGWTLVDNADALRELIEAHSDRITHLSLDWDLGPGVEKGDVVAAFIASRFTDDPLAFADIEWIYFHSMKREAALEMFRTVKKALPEDREYDILMDVGMPEDPRRHRTGRY